MHVYKYTEKHRCDWLILRVTIISPSWFEAGKAIALSLFCVGAQIAVNTVVRALIHNISFAEGLFCISERK
jgi:hypothetical protein